MEVRPLEDLQINPSKLLALYWIQRGFMFGRDESRAVFKYRQHRPAHHKEARRPAPQKTRLLTGTIN